jgi:glycyl-tRNA synthetase beta chain
MKFDTLLIEFITEELPPMSLKELGDKFGQLIKEGLKKQGLIKHDEMIVYSTPRRLGVKILNVSEKSEDQKKLIKLMPARIGFNENGEATEALLKKTGIFT